MILNSFFRQGIFPFLGMRMIDWAIVTVLVMRTPMRSL